MGFCSNEEKEKKIDERIDEIDEKLDDIYQKAMRFEDVLNDIQNLQYSLKHIRATNGLKTGGLK